MDQHLIPGAGLHNKTYPEHLTSQPNADTVTPDITTVKDTPDATLKPLTEDSPTTDAEDGPIL